MNLQMVIRSGQISGRSCLSKTAKPARRGVQAIRQIYWQKSHYSNNAFSKQVLPDKGFTAGNPRIVFQIISSPNVCHKQFHTTTKRFDYDPRVLNLRRDLNNVYENAKNRLNPAALATRKCQNLINNFHQNVAETTPFSERLNNRRRLLFELHADYVKHASNKAAFTLNYWSERDGRDCVIPRDAHEVERAENTIERLKEANKEKFKDKIFHLHVIDHDSLRYDATSFHTDDTGYIFMSKFEINKYSDSQLAGVLAHEMGHCVLQHYNEKKCNKIFFNESMINSAITIQRCCALDEDSKRPIVYVYQIFATVAGLIPSINDKGRHELEADMAAAYLSRNARYNPQEYINMFQQGKLKSEGASPGIIIPKKLEPKYIQDADEKLTLDRLESYVKKDIKKFINVIDLDMKHPSDQYRAKALKTFYEKLQKHS